MKNGHERSENGAMQDKKVQLWFQQNKWKVNIRKIRCGSCLEQIERVMFQGNSNLLMGTMTNAAFWKDEVKESVDEGKKAYEID